jgi:AcrR family transcriptional regulator
MGRIITFDKAQVFDICLQAFWQSGYDNTSVRDLQKLTGLSGRSLIHSYGDKRQIFDSCLQHYLEFVQQLTEGLAAKPEGLAEFFEGFTLSEASDVRHNGCFVLNSIYGTLKADKHLIQAFERFTRLLTTFFASQLTLQGVQQPNDKASVLFDVFLAGLMKISIYQNAKQMKDEFLLIQRLIAVWQT